jgi:ABC-2 type transport system permease protein
MNPPPETAPPVLNPAPPPVKALRRLFLTLFLRGRTSRGLQLKKAPKSLGEKLALVLLFNGLFGCFAFFLVGQPVFAVAVYLQSMTFVFLGMFIASSAGEILFNKEEADILLHRPVTSRDLLWSKIRVLVEVSLWLAGAFNLAGLFVGLLAPDGGWAFPLVHAISTILQALFCTSCIVVVYQLCLRWFGRERLDGLLTTAQVVAAVASVLAGQLLPQLVMRAGGLIHFGPHTWWIGLLPPAWFAGIDDAVAGSKSIGSWALGAFGLAATACTLWLAFGKLAADYEAGVQSIGETISRPRGRSKRRWADVLVNAPPLRWLLRTPVSRAAFLLTAAYLFRDRDAKLRIYPGLAPMLIMPVIFSLRSGGTTNFGLAFAAGYIAMAPLFAIELLQYSQQWQAADVFRFAPLTGPAELCHGARWAAIFILALPLMLAAALVMVLLQHSLLGLALVLPGLIAMPLVSVIPAAMKRGIPFSVPNEESKSAGRGLRMFAVVVPALLLSAVVMWSWMSGWFRWLILAEVIILIPLYAGLLAHVSKLIWEPIE